MGTRWVIMNGEVQILYPICFVFVFVYVFIFIFVFVFCFVFVFVLIYFIFIYLIDHDKILRLASQEYVE